MTEEGRVVSADTRAETSHAVSGRAVSWLRGQCADIYAAAERLDTARERLLDLADPRLPVPEPARLREAWTELARDLDLTADRLMDAASALDGWADELEAGGVREDPEH
jgi:hypothetical protein